MFSLPMTGWKAIEDRKEKVAMIELAYHTLQATPFISHFLKSPPSNFCGPGSLLFRPLGIGGKGGAPRKIKP